MIQFCKTTLGEEEKKAMCDVVDSGWVVMGPKTREFEEKFAEYVGAKYAVFVDSGTAALFLALQWIKKTHHGLKGLGVPSLTFTSTAEAVIQSNIPLVFVDVDIESPRWTFCISEKFEYPILLPVHLTGNRSPAYSMIYDSAHRIIRGDIKDSDALWCYSFYATKNITTINGGMIAMNDKNAYEWLKLARDHGISQNTEERYKHDKWDYDIEFIGWRLKADDVRAAIGLEQLRKLDWINKRRRNIVSQYNALLGLENTGLHLYPILVEKRPEFISFMQKNGVQVAVHFPPLHRMTAYKNYPHGDLPNTEYLGDRLVSLPLYPDLTSDQVRKVADLVRRSRLLIDEKKEYELTE